MKTRFAVMALSVETLDSLLKSFTGHETALKSSWLLVPHGRVAAAAKSRGFARVAEAPMSAETGSFLALVKLKPRINAEAS
ncbi:MAG: hypothetical protein IPP88_17085 [Betaproteobacteria bacterium]|nr:hypothetical protein [Betaproteobacteria bacterium]